MSNSTELLKSAMEFEDIARCKMQDALASAVHQDTKEALQKLIEVKDQNIDALHWLIMAESGKIEVPEETKAPEENGATRLAKGKCPFSAGELNKMGFNVTEEQLGRK